MNNRFTRLYTLFDQMTQELNGALSWVEDIEQRERILTRAEQDLTYRLQDIANKTDQLLVDSQEQARQKAYLEKENARINKLTHQLEYDRGELAAIDKKHEELVEKETELAKHELALAEKIKSLESLLQKEKELEQREALVTREKAIDRERKRMLDLRVKRIKEREQQLHIESEITEL